MVFVGKISEAEAEFKEKGVDPFAVRHDTETLFDYLYQNADIQDDEVQEIIDLLRENPGNVIGRLQQILKNCEWQHSLGALLLIRIFNKTIDDVLEGERIENPGLRSIMNSVMQYLLSLEGEDFDREKIIQDITNARDAVRSELIRCGLEPDAVEQETQRVLKEADDEKKARIESSLQKAQNEIAGYIRGQDAPGTEVNMVANVIAALGVESKGRFGKNFSTLIDIYLKACRAKEGGKLEEKAPAFIETLEQLLPTEK
ncbi:hypothetical protein ACFLZH_03825 [Patescibacteria group bacterium]